MMPVKTRTHRTGWTAALVPGLLHTTCLLGTPAALPPFGAIGGAMGGSAIGCVVGSIVDHRHASRAYVAVSLPLGGH